MLAHRFGRCPVDVAARATVGSEPTSRMRDAAKPPMSAWRTLAGSPPILDAKSGASPAASMLRWLLVRLFPGQGGTNREGG